MADKNLSATRKSLTAIKFSIGKQSDFDAKICRDAAFVLSNSTTDELSFNSACQITCDATLYLFGMLTSAIHMAWLRTVGGRLESRYRYSPSVYYNFPFVEPTLEQKNLIEQTAQNILDVRARYPKSTLADLYDELTMSADLRLAHKKNDRAVAVAYGWENLLDDESKIVAELMKLYERLNNISRKFSKSIFCFLINGIPHKIQIHFSGTEDRGAFEHWS